MGYYIEGYGCITVKAANTDAAFKAVCQLNADDSIKTGGQHPANQVKPADSRSLGNPNKWFSWMPWNYDETCTSLADVFTELDFEVTTTDDGDIIIGSFDSKSGNETEFLDAIAPFAEPTEYDWLGEDGSRWRDVYADGKREELTGHIIYR